jgi:predicted DNA-binding protein (UPF0251 family)
LGTCYTPILNQLLKAERMARPQKCRKIYSPPKMLGFKPFGLAESSREKVTLRFEEFESFKLINYDMMQQDQASKQMNVSRPTFTRIYNKTLKTIANAFVEGKAINIEGGNYNFEQDWYRCRKCFKLINGIKNHIPCINCTAYNENELIHLNSDNNTEQYKKHLQMTNSNTDRPKNERARTRKRLGNCKRSESAVTVASEQTTTTNQQQHKGGGRKRTRLRIRNK